MSQYQEMRTSRDDAFESVAVRLERQVYDIYRHTIIDANLHQCTHQWISRHEYQPHDWICQLQTNEAGHIHYTTSSMAITATTTTHIIHQHQRTIVNMPMTTMTSSILTKNARSEDEDQKPPSTAAISIDGGALFSTKVLLLDSQPNWKVLGMLQMDWIANIIQKSSTRLNLHIKYINCSYQTVHWVFSGNSASRHDISTSIEVDVDGGGAITILEKHVQFPDDVMMREA